MRMAELADIRIGKHGVFALQPHLVFVTAFRHKVFGQPDLIRMERMIGTSAATAGPNWSSLRRPSARQASCPTAAIGRLVNSLKSASNRRMRLEFPDLRRHYYRANKL